MYSAPVPIFMMVLLFSSIIFQPALAGFVPGWSYRHSPPPEMSNWYGVSGSVIFDSQGNVLVGGGFLSPSNTTVSLVFKVDPAGQFLWATNIGTGVPSMVTDAGGNIVTFSTEQMFGT